MWNWGRLKWHRKRLLFSSYEWRFPSHFFRTFSRNLFFNQFPLHKPKFTVLHFEIPIVTLNAPCLFFYLLMRNCKLRKNIQLLLINLLLFMGWILFMMKTTTLRSCFSRITSNQFTTLSIFSTKGGQNIIFL